jgi:hypothetical protein
VGLAHQPADLDPDELEVVGGIIYPDAVDLADLVPV